MSVRKQYNIHVQSKSTAAKQEHETVRWCHCVDGDVVVFFSFCNFSYSFFRYSPNVLNSSKLITPSPSVSTRGASSFLNFSIKGSIASRVGGGRFGSRSLQ